MPGGESDGRRYGVEDLVLVPGGFDFGDYGRERRRDDFAGQRALDAMAEQEVLDGVFVVRAFYMKT